MEAAHQSGRSSVRARAYRTLRPGTRVDRYRLLAPLGEGGQAAVWQAEDPLAPGELRAIKLIDLARATPSDRERTRREARALLELEHPSLCRPYGLFEDLDHEVLGLVMEHVDGTSLENLLDDRRLTSDLRDTILGQVIAVLAHVHAHGVVHRDLKPENILIASAFWSAPNDPSHVKLVDFGIAASVRPATRLTAPGFAIGTPPYMAPERIEPSHWGGSPDAPAGDTFSVGILAWRLAAGLHPVALSDAANLSDFAVAYRMAAKEGNWPPLLPAPSTLGCVIGRCLALRPQERWASAVELASELGIAVGEPERRVRRQQNEIEPPTVSTQPWVLPPTLEPPRPAPIPLLPTRREAPVASPVRTRRAKRGWLIAVTGAVAIVAALVGSSIRIRVSTPLRHASSWPVDPIPRQPFTTTPLRVWSPTDRYLQVATGKTKEEAIEQAIVFQEAGLAPTVFWTGKNNVVVLGPFADENARGAARTRFLARFGPEAEAILQPGRIYEEHLWP
jgi:eukaryotic-like serine/threonine-protein kinase